MTDAVRAFWALRLAACKAALEKNNFEAHVVADLDAARDLVLDAVLPATGAKSVSWGGSKTLELSGLVEAFKALDGLEVLDTFDKNLSNEDKLELRRRALLVDLFCTGSNAVTEDGMLVNLDMIGNRVGALAFGPKFALVIAGRNKVVADLDEAMLRIKSIAAPANALRLNKKTPCVKTSFCRDCSSEDRICNTWVINEKCYPQGRIKVVLVNQDLGI